MYHTNYKLRLQSFGKYNPIKYYLDGNANQVILTHLNKLYFVPSKRMTRCHILKKINGNICLF